MLLIPPLSLYTFTIYKIHHFQIPIVIVVVILTCIALFIWSKKSLLKAFAKFGSRTRTPPANTNSTSVTRELTAEQLAGSDTVEGLPAVRQPRRNRRPRRTPSQVSVTSLPVYNKEPGEEELVIFRCATQSFSHKLQTLTF